jgi:hypothetical protein
MALRCARVFSKAKAHDSKIFMIFNAEKAVIKEGVIKLSLGRSHSVSFVNFAYDQKLWQY